MIRPTRWLLWEPGTQAVVERLSAKSMRQGAEALTQLVGQPVRLKDVGVSRVMLSDLAQLLPDPEQEAVGVLVVAQGDLQGQFLLIVSIPDALALADLMLERPAGSGALDALARSALGEVGNQLSARFLDNVVEASQGSARPSPPVVLVDMAGALVDLWLTAAGRLEDYLLIVSATFARAERQAEARFLVLPDYATLRAIVRAQGHE